MVVPAKNKVNIRLYTIISQMPSGLSNEKFVKVFKKMVVVNKR